MIYSKFLSNTPLFMSQQDKATFVPWTGTDVVLFFALSLAAYWSVVIFTGIANSLVPFQPSGVNKTTVVVLLFLAMVVGAPLIEEFLFRLLCQGWLEAKLLYFRVPFASNVAIIIVSFCFAAVHGPHSGDGLIGKAGFCVLVAYVVLQPLIFTLGIIYLIWKRNVKITDYLFGTESFSASKFFTNVRYGLLLFLLCYGLAIFLVLIFEGAIGSPAIFFFSLVLGKIYSQTKNLSYCILFHASLNLLTCTLLLFAINYG